MKAKSFALVLLLLAAVVPCIHAADMPAISINSGDVTAASVEMNNFKHATDHTELVLTLTPQKQAEFAKFTAANKGKQTRLFVSGKLYSKPYIHDVINSRTGVLSVDTPEHAVTIAKKLLIAKPIPAVRPVKTAVRPMKLATVAMVRRRIKLGMTEAAVHHALRRLDAPNDGDTYATPMGALDVDNYQCSDGYVTVYYYLDNATVEGIAWPNHLIGEKPGLP